MDFLRFVARQKVLANFTAIIVSVVGLYFFATSPKESLPEIKLGVILINTVYPGAGPAEVESLVTDPIEEAVKNLKGIKEINSSSSESNSLIILSLEQSVKDTQVLLNDVKSAVSRAQGLPAEANEPEVIEVTTDEFPVLQVSLSGGRDYTELRSAARLMEDAVAKIPGVARVNRSGFNEKVIWIDVDGKKLNNYNTTIFGLMNSVKSSSISVPAGTKILNGKEYSFRTVSEPKAVEEIENITLQANEAGNSVRIKDVARVTEGYEEEQYKVRANGEPAIIFTILKSRGADTITINKSIRGLEKSMKPILPAATKISFANDSSEFIRDRIKLVNENGVTGAILVLLTIVLLLRPSISFLAAISIPIVFGASLVVIKMLGLTYDMLSLFGFVMAIGIVVDSGIVVAENVYRYMEKGLDPEKATVTGAGEVIVPVFASILTTISSFLPLILVSGVLGSFLRPIPVVIILTTIVSFFQAYLILPAQIAAFVRPSENKFTRWQYNLNETMKSWYGKRLAWALEKKWLVLGITGLLFILSFIAGSRNGFSFFTSQVDEAIIKVKCPAAYSLDQTAQVMLAIEKKAIETAAADLDAAYTFIGRQDGANSIPENSTNKGQINMVMKIESLRKVKDINSLINKLRDSIGVPADAEAVNISGVRREGGGARADIVVNITGPTFEKISEVTAKALEIIRGTEGVKEADSDFEQGKSEYTLVIDNKKAAIALVQPAQAAMSLRSYISGVEAAVIKKDGERVEINIRAGADNINTLDDILSLGVPNQRGKAVPIKFLVRAVESISYKSLRHKDTKKTVSISGSIDTKKKNKTAVNTLINSKLKALKSSYPDVDVETGGDFQEMMKNFTELGLAFLLSLILIYMILAALFNSLIQPFIMMMAIPLGFIGVMFTLFLHGMSISFAAFMGFVALSGVVVNNSVVLNDFVNRLRTQKGNLDTAIIEACKIRLRPIFLTAITTIVGLLPLGYGLFGSKDAFLQPVALVFSWGLTFSTFVTLFIIPIFISMFTDRKKGKTVAQKKRA